MSPLLVTIRPSSKAIGGSLRPRSNLDQSRYEFQFWLNILKLQFTCEEKKSLICYIIELEFDKNEDKLLYIFPNFFVKFGQII